MHRGYHQSWLARKILARQPLVTRMARNQLLPQVLGFVAGSAAISEQASFLPVPGLDWEQRPTSLLPGSVLRAPFREKMSDELEIAAVSYPTGEVLSQQVVESAEASNFERELPESGHKDDVQSDEFNEAVRVEIQQEQESEEGPAQSVKAKPSRVRIEESHAYARYVQPLPPSPSSSAARRNRQVTKTPQREDSPVEKTGREERSADELFAPRDTDRSPQAWMARLMGTSDATPSRVEFPAATSGTAQMSEQVMSYATSESVQLLPHSESGSATRRPGVMLPPVHDTRTQVENQPSIATRANDAVRSTTPISQRTRRFLQPLVGIDPTSVHVYRDPIAGRVTDDYQADAITMENDVEMAAGHLDDTPETLGLLAHELTHVARLREPHFIPPIARSMSATPFGPGQALSIDEEALALRVERRVERAAQKQIGEGAPFPTELTGGNGEAATGLTFVPRTEPDTWGGLPAPWESLPDWLATPAVTMEGSIPMPVISSQSSQAAYHASEMESKVSRADGSGEGQTRGSPVTVQRAGRERSEDIEEGQEAEMATSPQSSPADPAKIPEPDLDALARQVYAHLKRRLEVERRRES
jgi:hypothetical protein